MTDWIDFTVYFVFVAALWIVYPFAQTRLTIPLIADRNPVWLAAHPEAAERIAASRLHVWISFALGAVSLAVLTAFQVGWWHPDYNAGLRAPSGWMVLWDLAISSMIAALVIGGGMGIRGFLRLKKLVPLAPQRQATLERRSLDDYVPRAVRYAVYSAVVVNLVAWVAAAILGTHSSPVFWPRVVTMFVLSGFFWFFTAVSVARRPNVWDRLFASAYRCFEVRMTFGCQILTPIIGALRLYEEVNHTSLFDTSRAVQLCLAAFISYWLLQMSWLALRNDKHPRGLPASLSR
jgi:hypothetical protein